MALANRAGLPKLTGTADLDATISGNLGENDFRGERFRSWHKDVQGLNDLLNLTKPSVIEEIHRQYLEAGADIIETNTFSGTSIGLHDFLFRGEPTGKRKDLEFFQRVVDDAELSALVSEINLQAARIARLVADEVSEKTGRRRFVGGD